MKLREIRKAAKLIVRFEKDGAEANAGVNECVWCSEHYHIRDGHDPSALCDGCAHQLAVAFAEHITEAK